MHQGETHLQDRHPEGILHNWFCPLVHGHEMFENKVHQ